ncbi:unnamed protein product [Brassica rapa subsp. narinosa]
MSSMASLKLSPSSPISIPKVLLLKNCQSTELSLSNNDLTVYKCQRRRVVVTLGVVASWISLLCKAPVS